MNCVTLDIVMMTLILLLFQCYLRDKNIEIQ